MIILTFYVKTDALLSADVFEKFINRSIEFYKLDPSYYFSLSCHGLSWDTMLEITEIKFLASLKANNKHMKNYDPTKESKYTIHLDANNSYTWVMNLAYGEFKWVKIVDNSDVN